MKYYKICRKAENCKEDKMQETKPTTKTKVIVNGNKIAVYTTLRSGKQQSRYRADGGTTRQEHG